MGCRCFMSSSEEDTMKPEIVISWLLLVLLSGSLLTTCTSMPKTSFERILPIWFLWCLLSVCTLANIDCWCPKQNKTKQNKTKHWLLVSRLVEPLGAELTQERLFSCANNKVTSNIQDLRRKTGWGWLYLEDNNNSNNWLHAQLAAATWQVLDQFVIHSASSPCPHDHKK